MADLSSHIYFWICHICCCLAVSLILGCHFHRCKKWGQNCWQTYRLGLPVPYLHATWVLCSGHFEPSHLSCRAQGANASKTDPFLLTLNNIGTQCTLTISDAKCEQSKRCEISQYAFTNSTEELLIPEENILIYTASYIIKKIQRKVSPANI